MFMKKILLIILLGTVLALTGCGLIPGGGGGGNDDLTDLFESVEESGNLKTTFQEAVEAEIDPNLQTHFTVDFWTLNSVDLATGLYLAAVQLYLATPALSKIPI